MAGKGQKGRGGGGQAGRPTKKGLKSLPPPLPADLPGGGGGGGGGGVT